MFADPTLSYLVIMDAIVESCDCHVQQHIGGTGPIGSH
jgi:hypothetical protein